MSDQNEEWLQHRPTTDWKWEIVITIISITVHHWGFQYLNISKQLPGPYLVRAVVGL